MTPRSLRMSPSWTSSLSQSSSANSVRPEAEESLPRATTSNAPSWRSLSRCARSRRAQESSSKGERQTRKADPTNDMSINTRARAASSAGLAGLGHETPRSVWSTNDSYLPRAKPPPPLKLTKHKRDRSEHNKPPPDPTTSSQPSTSSNKSSTQSSQSQLTASHSFPSSLDVPNPDMSGEHRDGPVVQPALMRSSTRLTVASDASDDASLSFAPIEPGSSWKWKPPTSWAGPSNAVSADEDGSKPVGGWRFARKKSDESSSQDSSLQTPTRLNRARSHNELRPVHFANVGEPEGHVFGTGPLSPGLAVKIQCYENHEWQEKPVADVIPMLRELKIK